MLDLAGFDDEAARSAANVLLRFDAIKGADTFKRVETDAADLAVTMGTDLPAAAETLGQILQSPENAARKLRPIIGALTAEQQASIKAFVEQGDTAGATGLILDLLEGKIGGAAKAFGETLAGEEAKATEEMKNAKAEIVSGFAPAVQLGAEVTLQLAHGIEALPDPLRDVIGVVALTGSEILALSQPASALIAIMGRWKDAHEAAAVSTEAVAVSAGTATAATETETAAAAALLAVEEDELAVNAELIAFNDAYAGTAVAATVAAEGETLAFSGMLATLGPLAVAVGAAVVAFEVIKSTMGDSGKSAELLDKSTKQLTDRLRCARHQGRWERADGPAEVRRRLAQGTEHGDRFRDALVGVGLTSSDFAGLLAQGTQATGKFLANLSFHGAPDEFVTALGDVVDQAGEVAQATLVSDVALGKLTQTEVDGAVATHKMADGSTDWAAALASLGGTIRSTDDATKGLTESQIAEKNALDGMPGLVDDLASAMEPQLRVDPVEHTKLNVDYQSGIDDLSKSLHENGFTLDDNTEKGRANIDAALDAGDSIAKLIEKRFEETHSVEQATAAGDLYVENLRPARAGRVHEGQVDQLITTMHLTPDDINTTFSNNAVEQQIVVQKYIAQLDTIDPEVQTNIEALIDQGRLDEANYDLALLAQDRTSISP
jgi:hypothetical protein